MNEKKLNVKEISDFMRITLAKEITNLYTELELERVGEIREHIKGKINRIILARSEINFILCGKLEAEEYREKMRMEKEEKAEKYYSDLIKTASILIDNILYGIEDNPKIVEIKIKTLSTEKARKNNGVELIRDYDTKFGDIYIKIACVEDLHRRRNK